ncbi:ThiF family adenylyltransferase [Paenibacillus senegalensis]|uniref:ThiF family adenylyltransferase n=1 Tax=Paenibacillus senegalensis TaxID=1465766 RepID=UPI0004750370|nr:ThiF family adenylyltransferase [Paenibacillus senegalensis]
MAERYSRQMLFAPIGPAGQGKLLQARAAIVGMGALGTVLASHLVRAGVGFVRLIDRDFVEPSNLQRQLLYDEIDAEQSVPKAIAAAKRLAAANSGVDIEPRVADVHPGNAEELLADVDVILDGSDNYAVRYLINDVAVKHGIPWVYGGAVSSRGTTATIIPGETPCLACLFGAAPPRGSTDTCDTIGVIGPVVSVVASYQATEALKLLVGDYERISRSIVHLDLWNNQHSSIDSRGMRKPDCPACALKQFDHLHAEDSGEWIESLCGRDSVQIVPKQSAKLDLSAWAERFKPLGRVELNPFLLKFHIDEDMRLVLFADGRVLIQGTDDLTTAKSLYSRYIGM